MGCVVVVVMGCVVVVGCGVWWCCGEGCVVFFGGGV